MRLAGLFPAALCAATIAFAPLAAENAATGELVARDVLRVCANQNNLPYSDENGAGYENKIAELFARDLGVTVHYTWYPHARGFLRNTLRSYKCDLVMGITGVHELVQNSNPYYATGWFAAQRDGDGAQIDNWDWNSPALKNAKLGAMVATPPTTYLAEHNLLDNTRTYNLPVDTRVEKPAEQMLRDLADGNIDIAFVYGPIAGYWAKQNNAALKLIPLASGKGGKRMNFPKTMGLRYNEPLWKKRVNKFIRQNEKEIAAILRDYGIPTTPVK